MKPNRPYLPALNRSTPLRQITGFVWGLLTGFLLMPALSRAQSDAAYEETSVTLNVLRIGSIELPALIRDDSAYLSVPDLFEFLKINHQPSTTCDTINGYFMDPQASFLILKKEGLIRYKGKQFALDSGVLAGAEGTLYMRTDWFERVFQLKCSFSFRSLSILLSTNVELPAIREMRLAMMRSNLRTLKGEWKADTVVTQRSPFLSVGRADWAMTTKQQVKGVSEAALNLTLGARLAGGEATVALNYYNLDGFQQRQQLYQWRLVNNDHAALRQLVAGKFYTNSISSIYNPILGVEVTNTPSIYRRSFGSYTLSNVTEPNWTVELYVNDVLIDYVKADAAGFFTFQVPLVYGNSAVRLRFYGPYGEERTQEGTVLIPFNFLPRHEFNYSVGAGVVEDSVGSRFTRVTANYGLTRRITIGGGLEYLSSVPGGGKIPFVNTALRLASNLMLLGEYAYGVRTKALLTYRRPSNLQLELSYTSYRKGQRAIQNNYLEERNLLFSLPFRTRHLAAFTRLTLSQKTFPGSKYTSGEWLVSASAARIGANLTTYTLYNTPRDYLLYSNLALNFRLFRQISFMPQIQYEYRQQKISMLKGQVDKQFFRNGYLTLSYEKNFYYNMSNAGIGFRYDFSFAQTYTSVGRSNHRTLFVQSARGSLLYDRATDFLDASCRSRIGRGDVVMMPFLDINCNGHRDAGEPKVAGLKVRALEGTVQYIRNDTSVRISNLEPYVNVFIALDSNSFDNIGWRLRKKAYSIYVEANQSKLVEVPVMVVGEVSGTVFTCEGDRKKGMGRVVVSIYNREGVLIRQVETEGDGFFSYLGLAPGTYTASIDGQQLARLKLTPPVARHSFRIKPSREGDVADGLEFELLPAQRSPALRNSGNEDQ
ncbi:MAG: carboxypeptidase regulatory-like domain-containing protein [Williamsia sp.]|nr:carboxypeptidase regulatory-like domain-containing protein [Williamsia sp.]